jgi:uncharacterized C2H2 Zn-finger protein
MPARFALTLRLRDLDAFRVVCRRHGWEFRAGQRRYRRFSPEEGATLSLDGRCSHAVAIEGCRYEVGLIDQGGYWLPAWDDGPDHELQRRLGENVAILWQAYVREIAQRVSEGRGHILTSLTDHRNTLRLRVVSGTPGRVAHLCVRADAATQLWDLTPNRTDSFRYLMDALGAARLQEVELLYPLPGEGRAVPAGAPAPAHQAGSPGPDCPPAHQAGSPGPDCPPPRFPGPDQFLPRCDHPALHRVIVRSSMQRVSLSDLSICLDRILKPLSNRQRRPPEGQEARCPRCDRIMIVRMGKRMPEYHCACEEKGS